MAFILEEEFIMEPGKFTIILSIFSAAATAIWSVWTWSEQQKFEIALEQDKIAALYINPLIISGVSLNNHLDHILHHQGLAAFKKTYPDAYDIGSPAAFETLYLIAIYFAWEYYILRYGPYTKDSQTYGLVSKIANTFADYKYPGDAFHFSYGEQIALGKLAIQPVERTVMNNICEYDTVSPYQFVDAIKKELRNNSPLSEYKTVYKTIEAIDRAERVEELEGYERLIKIQNYLVALVDYLEVQQGLDTMTSKQATLRETNFSPALQKVDLPQILHRVQGRIRLRVPRLRYEEAYAKQLQAKVESIPEVQNVKINLASASVVVNYSPSLPNDELEYKILAAVA
jgi:hypothetical protein